MKKAFTLVELLIYIAILGTMLIGLTSFIFLSYQARIKSQAVAEVEQQGNQIVDILLYNINKASSITLPPAQGSGTGMTLLMPDASNVVVATSGDTLTIKKGALAAVPLTGNRVTISGVSFSNLSRTGTKGVVRIQFTLGYKNNAGTNEYDYTKTFYSTGGVR